MMRAPTLCRHRGLTLAAALEPLVGDQIGRQTQTEAMTLTTPEGALSMKARNRPPPPPPPFRPIHSSSHLPHLLYPFPPSWRSSTIQT